MCAILNGVGIVVNVLLIVSVFMAKCQTCRCDARFEGIVLCDKCVEERCDHCLKENYVLIKRINRNRRKV